MRENIPSMDQWLRDAKNHPDGSKIGMIMTHNGVVRQTAKAQVRYGDRECGTITEMIVSYDQNFVDDAIRKTYEMDGIYYVRVWLNEGTLNVGEDIMYVMVGGDIRQRVFDALQFLLSELKGKCISEQEIFSST